ncbi:MAG: 4a-hydroxytetrahydrobiopterin dehydratase [Blastocatellia bacterium]|nr:4a-hydroxytetrahydrobiopterin dehydratase [Blastocatellia bacterium]
MSRRKFAEAEIEAALKLVPDWEQKDAAIVRVFQFTDFKEAMVFVNQVAELAEAADHHPDITINWNRVTLLLTTHDRGGLTQLDFDLAGKIDGIEN